jgi:hypothetical protein
MVTMHSNGTAGVGDGLQIGVAFAVADRELSVTAPNTAVNVPVALTGAGQGVTGTARGGAVPAGVGVDQVQVAVPATSAVNASVPVTVDRTTAQKTVGGGTGVLREPAQAGFGRRGGMAAERSTRRGAEARRRTHRRRETLDFVLDFASTKSPPERSAAYASAAGKRGPFLAIVGVGAMLAVVPFLASPTADRPARRPSHSPRRGNRERSVRPWPGPSRAAWASSRAHVGCLVMFRFGGLNAISTVGFGSELTNVK